jgi:hypothetical protein
MLKAKIASITNDKATISFEDGQTLIVSTASIEGTPKAGADVACVLASLGSEDAGRTRLAQDLLNELLKA